MNKIYRLLKYFMLVLFVSITITAQVASSKLVPVKDIIPNIVIDLKYASTDNFFKQKLYASNECYLLNDLVKKLALIQDTLNKVRTLNGISYPNGIGIKIWDGYRPRSVQYVMFELFPDPTYVADPSSGSSHNRGGAVDLTLVDLSNGKELKMPTGFDDFSNSAGHDFPEDQLLPEVYFNREYIKSIMTNIGGLTSYIAEWWHYQLTNNKDYPLLDFQIK